MLPDVGGLEWLVIAVVALIVIGPKDLPVMMRKVGQFMAKLRGMAAEFRSSFDEMARQSELDDLRKEVEAMRRGQFAEISDAAGVNEMQQTIAEIDQNLADVGVQLQPMSYQYDSSTEPPAIEAPKKAARKPRVAKAEAKPAPKKVAKAAPKPPVKAAAAKSPAKTLVAKAPAPRKARAKKAGGQA